LATPSDLRRTRKELGRAKPLGFILPQNIPRKAIKPPISRWDFWRVVAPVVAKIATDTYLSRAGILLKAPIEVAI